ncbi:hypothetical protein NAP1_10578 [Erythrobacter sp. NAP1]|nr:hypothetical protein NAP1_10578 [Erythrobacter sp. NAP1]
MTGPFVASDRLEPLFDAGFEVKYRE